MEETSEIQNSNKPKFRKLTYKKRRRGKNSGETHLRTNTYEVARVLMKIGMPVHPRSDFHDISLKLSGLENRRKLNDDIIFDPKYNSLEMRIPQNPNLVGIYSLPLKLENKRTERILYKFKDEILFPPRSYFQYL